MGTDQPGVMEMIVSNDIVPIVAVDVPSNE